MKKIALVLPVILTLLQSCTNSFNGIKIIGKVKNSNQEYVFLAHAPLYRGNYNSDGFRSIGNRINDKGNFSLFSDKLIDAASYWIEVKGKAFPLILFNGDNLKLEFDLNDTENSFFAQGKGAGKINVLRLLQFNPNNWYDTLYTIETYKPFVDSIINSQLMFLNLIYNKDLKNEALQKAENKQTIINIINNTPLSEKEYAFLKKKILIQDIYYLSGIFSYLSQEKKTDTFKIDFNTPYFSCFNPLKYKEFENINCWQFEGCINEILKIEYLKSHQKDSKLTYANFEIDNYSKFSDWSFTYAKSNLNAEVFNAYFTNKILCDLSMGHYNEEMYEKFVKSCDDKRYLNNINKYIDLLNNGLSNVEYNLNASTFTLDSVRFDSLINNYIGKDLYLVIWSAQFAGSTIIPGLPSIIDFEKENREKIDVIYVCIDKNKYKNLWAARIIDNSWKGNHYFLPAENNENIIKHFGAQNISGFCYGGATYSFINKKGELINSVEAPILLTKEKIEKYIN